MTLDLLTDLMGKAEGRCAYAEARHVESRDEALSVRAGEVDDFATTRADGHRRARPGRRRLGLRRDARRERRGRRGRARRRARRSPRRSPPGRRRRSRRSSPARGHWSSPHEVDPFDVSLEDKLELLFAAEAALRAEGGDDRIVRSLGSAARVARAQGVRLDRGRGVHAGARRERRRDRRVGSDGSELQVRSYPLAHGGLFAAAGWEHVLALDLAGHAPRVTAEAIELLTAPVCPEGVRTIVLDGEQLALQVHESVGHALELDRILLGEASYAGTSWVTARRHRLGALRLRAHEHHRRRDAARRARVVRLGRRGRPGEPLRARRAAACCARRSPTASRPPRSGSTAPAAARAPTASPASRSCG